MSTAALAKFASELRYEELPLELSPELHTVLLPAPHVRVGNGRWNYRFRSGHKASCETENHATFRSH